jgi:peptidoglycan/LPS O-acetylase OafA/YrhL
VTGRPTQASVPAHDFPALDTLRAVGALAVLTTHTTFWSGDYTRHLWLGTLFSRLDVGVALFFVLSGFLLSRPWILAAATAGRAPGTGRYAWKRFLRIVPVYAVTVVIAYVFIEANQDRSLPDLASTLLMLDSYHDTELPDGLTQMWSLSVEVAFYAILPLLMAALLGRRPSWHPTRVAVGLGLAGVCALVWWGWAAFAVSDSVDASPLQWLPGYLLWFSIGIGFAWLHIGSTTKRAGARARATTAQARRLAARPGVMWVLALGLLLISATPLAGPALLASPTPAQAVVKNLVYAAVAACVVLPAVFGDPHAISSKVMAHRLPRHIGLISYSLFCIHLPVLHLVMWGTGWALFEGHGLQIWTLTLVLSLVLAELLYRVVELPAMRLRNLGRRGAPDSPSTSSAATATTTR